MRVIAGLYRGRNLKNFASPEARPTSDRLRETLFNVLAPRIDGDVSFLDLCAGTGAVGIEALSRGAVRAVFVERSRRMCDLIRANLDLCRVSADRAKIVKSAAAQYLADRRHAASDASFDLIYYDPPYADDYSGVLEAVGAGRASGWLAEDGLLVAEHYSKNVLPEAIGTLVRTRTLKQGDSALSFYALGGNRSADD